MSDRTCPRMIYPDDEIETNGATLARLLAEQVEATKPVCNCGALLSPKFADFELSELWIGDGGPMVRNPATDEEASRVEVEARIRRRYGLQEAEQPQGAPPCTPIAAWKYRCPDCQRFWQPGTGSCSMKQCLACETKGAPQKPEGDCIRGPRCMGFPSQDIGERCITCGGRVAR